jgi:Zn-dependent M28 family amino/carboxypeptidase
VSLAAALLAAAAAAGALADEPRAPSAPGIRAHEIAVRLAAWGPRPAAGAAEARAHRLVAKVFRRAGLRVGEQEFAVPGRGRSRNVIGVYDTPRNCLRIVMAHTDSTPNSPGANDNASGVGVVAELAGRLERIVPACDVWLVATGAEERVYTGSPDHLGALALARRVRARGGRLRLRWALSLDEVGRDRPFWLRSPRGAPRPSVEEELLAASRRARTPASWVRDGSTGNSDHREFELLGLPAAKLGVGAGGEPCRHSPCDRAARLDPTSLRLARRLVAEALRAP